MHQDPISYHLTIGVPKLLRGHGAPRAASAAWKQYPDHRRDDLV